MWQLLTADPVDQLEFVGHLTGRQGIDEAIQRPERLGKPRIPGKIPLRSGSFGTRIVLGVTILTAVTRCVPPVAGERPGVWQFVHSPSVA
jgi:hypothetical protein